MTRSEVVQQMTIPIGLLAFFLLQVASLVSTAVAIVLITIGHRRCFLWMVIAIVCWLALFTHLSGI